MTYARALLYAVVLVLGFYIGWLAHPSPHHLTPIANVPLHADPKLEPRLGMPVAAADIGLGIPCAVYRNGPAVQPQLVRGETVVFACGIP